MIENCSNHLLLIPSDLCEFKIDRILPQMHLNLLMGIEKKEKLRPKELA